jgi:D-alanine-D-alanine ligase
MTPTSAFPKLWAAAGVRWPEACDRLLALALERFRAERGDHRF